MQTPATPQEILLSKIQNFISVSKKSSDKQIVENLSRQLTSCIKESWFFPMAHQLLTSPSSFATDRRDKEILISSFVKDKFKFDFESLNITNVEVHYSQLCEIAFALKNSSFAAYTNIALSLAYTYLHLLALHLSPIENYLSRLMPDKPQNIKLYNIYYKTLEFIASEIDNNKFVMDELHRETAKQRLIQQQLNVLHLLNQYGSQAFESGEVNRENILNAFQAWISLNYQTSVMNDIPNHGLFKKALQHMSDEDCGEGASNCLRSIIYQLKDPVENAVLYQTLTNCTLQILILVQNSQKNLQLDKAEDFIRIIADFSKKSIPIFINNYDKNIESYFKKLILYLQDELLNTYQTLSDFFLEYLQAIKKAKANNQTVNPSIFLIIDPLYTAHCYKCQIPNRIMKQLDVTQESKAHHISTPVEELFRHREFTDEIFQLIGELQGKEQYVQMVVGKITSLGFQDQKRFWSLLQIYLYSLIDVIKEYPTLDQAVASIVGIYSELSVKGTMFICVKRTFLRVFRSILFLKAKDVNLAYRIMCIAVSCFQQPLLMSVAQKTFCRACEQNKQTSTSIFSEFIPVLEKYTQRQYIVKGLMTVLCHEGALIAQYLHQMLTFLITKYKQETSKSRRKEILHSIIAALKVYKESPLAAQYMSILLQFTRDNWLYIKQVISKPLQPRDDEDSDVERMVRIVKTLMRILQVNFSEFLEELFALVLSAFQTYPLCSYVYLVQVAVTVYAKNPLFADYLKKLYSSFCDLAFLHMQRMEDLGRYSYLLDDFMGMNKRFFLYNASIVLSSGKLPMIINLATNAFVGCDIPRVAKASYSFFQTIFIVYWPPQFIEKRNKDEDITPFIPIAEDAQSYQTLKGYLLPNLQQIMRKMFQHLQSAPTEQTRDYILDTLLSEVKAFIPQNPIIWTQILLRVDPEILVQKQKERMVELLKSLQGAPYQSAKGIVKAFDRMLVLMNQRLVNADKRKKKIKL